MNYKGYTAEINYSEDDDCLVGFIIGIKAIISFHVQSIKEIKKAFHESVDFYRETTTTPEKPYSGKMMLRVSPNTHVMATLSAQREGKSLNKWAEEVLRHASHSSV